jgi:hypothetical protein
LKHNTLQTDDPDVSTTSPPNTPTGAAPDGSPTPPGASPGAFPVALADPEGGSPKLIGGAEFSPSRYASQVSESRQDPAQNSDQGKRGRRAGLGNLLRGDAAVRAARQAKVDQAEAKAAEARRRVDQVVQDELASLPPELAASPVVRRALTNSARAQLALDAMHDRLDRGEKVSERSLETAVKLASAIQSAAGDILARWPRAEDRLPRLPTSYLDWARELDRRVLGLPDVPTCPTCRSREGSETAPNNFPPTEQKPADSNGSGLLGLANEKVTHHFPEKPKPTPATPEKGSNSK